MKKWLSLAAVAALAVTFTACTEDGATGATGATGETLDSTTSSKVSISELSAPVTDVEKSTIRSSSKVTYNNGDEANVSYTTLMATGQSDNNEIFGMTKDYQDKLITGEDGNPLICNGTSFASEYDSARGSGLDHSSILQKDGRLFMVSQFECGPSAMYGFELEQDATTGALSAKKDTLQYISQKEGFGGWVHCAGMTTPWNSHLGSEEYPANAKEYTSNGYAQNVSKYYWGDANISASDAKFNPYYYGYIPEVTVDGSGTEAKFTYQKHYSMGRAAWEMAYVMPDEKTAYLSDDGSNVGFYMYVADKAQDLSAGTLYTAKWIQTSNIGAGKADLMWIKMGHATDAELKTLLDAKPTFDDIFETANYEGNLTCPENFTYSNAYKKEECLKVKDGKEKHAAFFETTRYASMLGGTTEFSKEEGITFNPDQNRLYVAMSRVEKGMVDELGDVQLPERIKCGAVYSLDVMGEGHTAYDSKQNVINSSYVVKNMHSLIEGADATYPEGSAYETYTCSANSISMPDNVAYLKGQNILAIGEDTGYHPNDFVWALDTVTGKLTRIVSTPYGSETTSPFWHEDVNGFGYLTLTTQHPFGEIKDSNVEYALAQDANDTTKASTIGVFGPFDFTAGDGKGNR